jgi:hypothetical protein
LAATIRNNKVTLFLRYNGRIQRLIIGGMAF